MAKTGSRRFMRFHYRGGHYEVTEQQWRVLELLSPNWIFIKWSVIHFNTRLGLKRRGWCEFNNVQGYLHARLSAAGREIRDEVYRRLAIRHARAMGEKI